MVLETILHWPGEAVSRLKPGRQMQPSGKQDFLQQGGNKQAPETCLVWLILPRGTGWAEHPPPFLQFSAVPSQIFPSSGHQALLKMGYPGAGWDELPWFCHGQDLSPGGQRHREARGSLWFLKAQPGAQTRACECCKNKQPDLDLFLRFREAGDRVSLAKQSPFLQWHFKDDSTSLTSSR